MFRKTIMQEMRRRGCSAYRLGKVSGLPIRTVQRYVAGDNDLPGERVAQICKALDLELRPKRRRKAR